VERHGLARFKADENNCPCVPNVELLGYEIFFRKLRLLKKMNRFHKKNLRLRIARPVE